jgi:hypothetical protein
VWRLKCAAVRETVLDGNIIPTENLQRIQVVHSRERVKFMKPRCDAAVLDIRQAADMKDQFRAPPARCQLKTGALNIAICQTKPFSGLSETKTGKHMFLGRELGANKAEYSRITILLRIRNDVLRISSIVFFI